MEPGNNEEQVTIDIDYSEIPEADDDSDTDEPNSDLDAPIRFFTDHGMLATEEASIEYRAVKKIFLSGMGLSAEETRIVGIYKNMSSSLTGQARLSSFKIFKDAVASKCGGDANVRCAWYGTARDEIREILCHGFSRLGKLAGNGETYGHGIHLSHARFSMDSVLSSEIDENGLRHVLLCFVILGNMEAVPAGSGQFCPSFKDYDSGVDNIATPIRYTVWSCSMNTHIYLSHIVSFRFPYYEGACFRFPYYEGSLRFPYYEGSTRSVPSSTWTLTIIKILSMFLLDPLKMALIHGYRNDLQENRITWSEFRQKVAKVSGVNLFNVILKLHNH